MWCRTALLKTVAAAVVSVHAGWSAPSPDPAAGRRLLAEAQGFCNIGQWQQCETAARAAVAADSRATGAHLILGLLATRAARFAEAELSFRTALAIEPNNARTLAYLGTNYLRQGRAAQAAEEFRKVLTLDRTNSAAHHNLGLIALSAHDFPAARSHFSSVLEKKPRDVAARFGMLEAELGVKDGDAVKRSTTALEELVPGGHPARLRMAALLASNGEYGVAIRMLVAFLQQNPDSVDAGYNLALAYYRTGGFDKAAEALRRVPEGAWRAEFFDLLGDIEEALRHPDKALAAYSEAARLDPANEDYSLNVGRALLNANRAPDAVRGLQDAARRQPQSWRLRVGLGAALYIAGMYEEAAEELLRVAHAQPEFGLTYFLLVRLYESAPNAQDRVAATLASHLERDPGDAWAWYDVGHTLYLRMHTMGGSDFAEAERYLRKAVELDPRLADAWFLLASVMQAEERIEDSLPMLERAVALKPELASAHYQLALAYQRLGQEAKARAEFTLYRERKSAEKTAEQRYILDRMQQPSHASEVQPR